MGDGTSVAKRGRRLLAALPLLLSATALLLGTIAGSSIPVMSAGTTGAMWVWGTNGADDLHGPDRPTPGPVGDDAGGQLSGVTAISAGGDHSLSLKNGRVFAWGENSTGEGNSSDHPTPALGPGGVGTLEGISAISASKDDFDLALRQSDGVVLAWGDCYYGQTGNPATWGNSGPLCPHPTPVPGFSGATAVSGGGDHALALVGGRVWAWGDQSAGQMGDGVVRSGASPPVQVPGLAGVSAIAAGGSHSLALIHGQVWAWGSNQYGELGNSTTNGRPVRVPNLDGVTAISAGLGFSLALKDGRIWAWGRNDSGQLGVGDTANRDAPAQVMDLSQVSSIDAGPAFSLAISGGEMWAWGTNSAYNLGQGSYDLKPHGRPIKVSGGLQHVTAVAAGGPFGLALTDSAVAPTPTPTPTASAPGSPTPTPTPTPSASPSPSATPAPSGGSPSQAALPRPPADDQSHRSGPPTWSNSTSIAAPPGGGGGAPSASSVLAQLPVPVAPPAQLVSMNPFLSPIGGGAPLPAESTRDRPEAAAEQSHAMVRRRAAPELPGGLAAGLTASGTAGCLLAGRRARPGRSTPGAVVWRGHSRIRPACALAHGTAARWRR